MLRAGLIGFPSAGKTALFQLLTSAREAPRPSGKSEANVGVSRVPDDRLDRLTAIFKPRKHVPATVEFADIAGVGGAKVGAAALLDVAPFRNADALLHVVRMFRDPSVPHPAGTIDPARDVRTMEDEIILADLGVVERRLERLERDLKKGQSAELRKEHEILVRCRAALEEGLAEAPEDQVASAAIALEGCDARELVPTLKASRSRDAAAGRTTEGPHRQDLVVLHRGKQVAAARSSTGEQKALLIGLILAHAELVAERRREPPILLLDEVAAHLDSKRRAALFERLAERGQVWMTATEAALFEGIGQASRFHVTPGRMTPA